MLYEDLKHLSLTLFLLVKNSLIIHEFFNCTNPNIMVQFPGGPDQRGGPPDMRGRGMPPDVHDRGPTGPNHRDFHGPPDGPPPHGRGMPPHDRGNVMVIVMMTATIC